MIRPAGAATGDWKPAVLVVHEHYRQPGGEDRVFEDEITLLERNGHRVLRFTRHNNDVEETRPIRLLMRTIWNAAAAAQLEDRVRRERVDIVHFHNTFPLISPAAYGGVRRAGAAVVQTLHNYRLICPGSLLMRAGRPCERCVGRPIPWPGVVHACYRESRPASAASAAMLTAHRALGTWDREVDRFIALTRFSRSRFVAGGLPADRIAVKPNFVMCDPGAGPGPGPDRPRRALFVGRLSEEKGVRVLLDAARRLGSRLHLTIIGDGPLAPLVSVAADELPTLLWRGRLPPEEVSAEMGRAAFLVVPSLWYENFPRVIVESLARGTPVLASRLGALAEIVRDDVSGSRFDAGDAGALARTLERWIAMPRTTLDRVRDTARGEFERDFSAERNYARLIEIYRAASGRRALRPGSDPTPAVDGPVAR